MKKTFTVAGIITAMLLALAICAARARAAVTVYGDEVPSTSAVTATTSAGSSNVPVERAGSGAGGSSDASNPSVRVDETGVHIRGPNPVDIQTPRGTFVNPVPEPHLVSLVAVAGPFVMVVAIVALAGYFAHRRNKMAHETLRAMIDKGVPITPELVAELKSRRSYVAVTGPSRSGRLLPGLVLAGIGTALLLAGHGGDQKGGWIVLFIGIAFLLVWVVERKHQNGGPSPR